MLTVYIDFKSPASYLAIMPTLALSERLGIGVNWRPFETAELEIPGMNGNNAVGESHRKVRSQSRRAIHMKYAAVQGVELRFPEMPGATGLALGVLAGLKGDPLNYIRAAFDAYWTGHANLDDPDTVAALLIGSGYETGNLDGNTSREALAQAQAVAEEQGVFEAPTYVLDDQLFIGREHLPWIEESIRARI